MTPADHGAEGRRRLGWPSRAVVVIPCLASLSEWNRRCGHRGHSVNFLAREGPMSGLAFSTILVASPIEGVRQTDAVHAIVRQDNDPVSRCWVLLEEAVAGGDP
jgi:hypothetical protein